MFLGIIRIFAWILKQFFITYCEEFLHESQKTWKRALCNIKH